MPHQIGERLRGLRLRRVSGRRQLLPDDRHRGGGLVAQPVRSETGIEASLGVRISPPPVAEAMIRAADGASPATSTRSVITGKLRDPATDSAVVQEGDASSHVQSPFPVRLRRVSPGSVDDALVQAADLLAQPSCRVSRFRAHISAMA